MKQKEVLERISVIRNLARGGGFNQEMLMEKMNMSFSLQGVEPHYSLRTFQRDLHLIRELYDIDIQFNRGTGKYSISEEETTSYKKHLMEYHDLINAFNLAEDLKDIVFFDDRKAKGTEHLSQLVQAIKKSVKIRFRHFGKWKESKDFREVSPLALKEVKNAWYLIALNEKEELRNYGLDRIHDLTLGGEKFDKPNDLDLQEYYQNVFGILNDRKIPVQTIVLSFTQQQGHYIKSMPIHHSQKVIQDDGEGLVISLELKINHELISEILSYQDQVKVLSPEELKNRVMGIVGSILK